VSTDGEVLKDHYGKPASKIEGKIKEFEIAENGVGGLHDRVSGCG
jgi:hypothetical protein